MTNHFTPIVEKIMKAHRTKQPTEFIRHQYQLSEEEAYAVQDDVVAALKAFHNSDIAGYKVSMTSEETQAIAQTDEPAYGTLLQSSVKKSGDLIKLNDLFAPLIEPEIMFILTDDLTSQADEEEILSKTKICAGIEIPDARYKDWFPNFSLADLLVDNTATGLVVLSEPISPLPLSAFASIKMALFYNDEKVSEGISSDVLGNPVHAVQWLVKKLSQRSKSLTKGMIISSGTFIPPLQANKGTYRIVYDNVGEVNITFA